MSGLSATSPQLISAMIEIKGILINPWSDGYLP